MNDPSQAEPLLNEMIKIEPTEAANYVMLSKMYEDAGQYDEAEQTLVRAREASPNDTNVYQQLASYYNRQGEFEKTIAALNERAAKEPNNPDGYYTIATYYWEKAYRDFRLKTEDKLNYIKEGVAAADKALEPPARLHGRHEVQEAAPPGRGAQHQRPGAHPGAPEGSRQPQRAVQRAEEEEGGRALRAGSAHAV